MDYTSPIALRTRRREAEVYKKIHAEIVRKKKKNNLEEGTCTSTESSSVVRTENEHCSGIKGGNFCEVTGMLGCSGVKKSAGGLRGSEGFKGREDAITVDDSEDAVVFVGERCESEDGMKGKEFVLIADDDDDDDGEDDGGVGGNGGGSALGENSGTHVDNAEEERMENERESGSCFGVSESCSSSDEEDDADAVSDDDGEEVDEDDSYDPAVDALSMSSDDAEESGGGDDVEEVEEFVPWKRHKVHGKETSLYSNKDKQKYDDGDGHCAAERTRSHSSSDPCKGSKVKDGDDNDDPDDQELSVSFIDAEEFSSEDDLEEVDGEVSLKEIPLDSHKDPKRCHDGELRRLPKWTGFDSVEEASKGKTETVPVSFDKAELDEDVDDDVFYLGERCGHGETSRHNKRKFDSREGNGIEINAKKDMQDSSRSVNYKRQRPRALKESDAVKILADSIFVDSEVSYMEEDEPYEEPTIERQFTFGVEESKPPEKSEEEKELDELWAEMALALCGDDTTDTAKIKTEADVSSLAGLNTAALCRLGKHELILDEEIGVICKYCSFVQVEMKYYVPPFGRNSLGKSRRRDYGSMQHDILDLHQDSGDDLQPDSGRFSLGTVWDIIPGIGKGMHDHQREGFEFLWKNIAGEIYLDKLKDPTSSGGGNGCIISHAPGTGKTRLAIAFLRTYLKLYPTCRPVIVAPTGMLLAWEAEFRKWQLDVPFHNLNTGDFSGMENKAALRMFSQIKSRNHKCSPTSVRMVKLYSWKKDTSVLGLSYKLFEELVGGGGKKKKVYPGTEDNRVGNLLLDLTGVLVLDEGHTPRNDRSLIWKTVSKIQTRKRIVLSGTPFQNNFDELFNTFSLANPKFMETMVSKCFRAFPIRRHCKRDEARGQWASLTSPIGKLTDDRQRNRRLEKVREMIGRFVHVHRGDVLQRHLPGLRDSVIILQPEHYQKTLLESISKMRNRCSFNMENWTTLVSVHPSLLPRQSFDKEECEFDWSKLEGLALNPEAGVKTKFLMELIRFSEARNEKVLVFSQYLPPLNLIIKQLKSHFNWMLGEEVLHMHGQLDAVDRQSLIKDFNNPKNVSKVLLASTRACCEGINLVGASRVVLLDVVWNPSVEKQAICRAYRLGQEKVVFVYHLVASGTMEEEKYRRQVGKEWLSELVFYSSDQAGNHPKASLISEDKKDKILEEMLDRHNLKSMFRKIIYQPKESLLMKGLMDLQ